MTSVTVLDEQRQKNLNENHEVSFVDPCKDHEIERLHGKPYPDIKEFDFSVFDHDRQRSPWPRWNLLDDAIRHLMKTLHEQYRANVVAKRQSIEGEATRDEASRGFSTVYTLDELSSLYTRVFELVSNERLGRSSRALFLKYQKRCAFFAKFHVCATSSTVEDGPSLLRVLVATTKNFLTFLEIMNQLFMALDSSRTYSIHDARPTIDTHGKTEFYNEIFDTSKSMLKYRVVDSMLQTYRRLRCNPSDECFSAYKDVIVEVFTNMSRNDDIFDKDYRGDLIVDITNFYFTLGQYWRDGEVDCSQYIQHFPSWAQKEKLSLAEYASLCEKSFALERDLQMRLHDRTHLTKKVEQVLQDTLIVSAVGDNAVFNMDNLDALFAAEDFTTIKQLHSLFKVSAPATQLMSAALEKHIYNQGMAVITKAETDNKAFRDQKMSTVFKNVSLSENNKRALENAIKNRTVVLKELITLTKRHEKLVVDYFEKEFSMNQAFRQAYQKIANQKIDGNAQDELLPIYVNRIILRQEYKTDTECSMALEHLSDYFQFIKSKDTFMLKHRDLLARRLLAADDAPNSHLEQHFLQQISAKEGVQFTSQAEKQLQDRLEKTDTNSRFDTWRREKSELKDVTVDFDVLVIAKKAWPVDNNLGLFNDCILPEELRLLNDGFDEFYKSSTKRRLLTWLHRKCYATMKFSPSPESMTNYRIKGNGQQVAILCLFDNYDTKLTKAEIQTRAGICPESPSTLEQDHANKVLKTLTGAKLPILKRASREDDDEVEQFEINEDFKHKDRVLTLPEPHVLAEIDKKQINEDRSLSIQFTVVKCMKLRKQMTFNDLINETMDQLKQFKPQARAVKEGIDYIIAKEWIKRDPNDHNLLHYVS